MSAYISTERKRRHSVARFCIVKRSFGQPVLALLALLAIAIIPYLPLLQGEYLFDDLRAVAMNSDLQRVTSLRDCFFLCSNPPGR